MWFLHMIYWLAAGAVAVVTDLKDPPRLAAAEVLVGRLVVCWEMITGAAAAGVLPHGCVPLAPLDVAANLTPGIPKVLQLWRQGNTCCGACDD